MVMTMQQTDRGAKNDPNGAADRCEATALALTGLATLLFGLLAFAYTALHSGSVGEAETQTISPATVQVHATPACAEDR